MLALTRFVVTRSVLGFTIRPLTLCKRNIRPLLLLLLLAFPAGRGRATT